MPRTDEQRAWRQWRRSQGLSLSKRPKKWGNDPKRYASAEQRRSVLERDGYECRYCGDPVTDQTANIDHLVPWHLRGPTKERNLVTACHGCNRAKYGTKAIARRLENMRTPEEVQEAMQRVAFYKEHNRRMVDGWQTRQRQRRVSRPYQADKHSEPR